MKLKILTLVILALVAAGCGGGPSADVVHQLVPSRAPAAHVFLVVEENQSFSTVYHKQMPWLSALGDKYGIATNYYSDQSGSLLDYLWISSGSV